MVISKTLLLKDLEKDNVVTLGRGKVISKDEINDMSGDYPVYSSSAQGDGIFGKYGNYMFDDERVTWSIDGGGRLFYRKPHKYSVTNVSGWIKVNQPDVLNTKYLYYCLTAQWKLRRFDYTYKAHPSVIREIYEVRIPGLHEQEKIVLKLEKLEHIIRLREQQIDILDNLVKARFVEMFENTGNSEKTISYISVFCSRGKSPKYVELSKLKVINQACIYWNHFKFQNVKYNDESYTGDKILSNNDLLICSTGTGTLGRCNIFKAPDDCRYMADSHVTIIRLNGKILPEVFKVWFERPKTQDLLYGECVSGSTNQIELSKEKLQDLRVPVPPKKLQIGFAAFVAQVDKSKFALSNKLAMRDFYISLINNRIMHSSINLRMTQ